MKTKNLVCSSPINWTT